MFFLKHEEDLLKLTKNGNSKKMNAKRKGNKNRIKKMQKKDAKRKGNKKWECKKGTLRG
jgi:hypothetical protein